MTSLLIFILTFLLTILILRSINRHRRMSSISEKIRQSFPYKLTPTAEKPTEFAVLIYQQSRLFWAVILVVIPFFLFIMGLLFSIFIAFLLILFYYFVVVFATMAWDGYLRHRKVVLLKQLPGAIEILIRRIKLGSPIDSAIQVVIQETHSPVKQAFSTIYRNLTLQEPLGDAMGSFSRRYPLSAYQLLFMIIKMHKKTGSSPVKSLDRVSKIADQDHDLFSRADTALTQGRLALVVMLLAPIVLLSMIYRIKPDLLTLFVTSNVGKMTIIGLGFCYLSGLLVFNRILKLDL